MHPLHSFHQKYKQMDNLNITKLDKGVAKCPFNPHANITTLMTENGKLFVASPTDFSGNDPAILRADVAKVSAHEHKYLFFLNRAHLQFNLPVFLFWLVLE